MQYSMSATSSLIRTPPTEGNWNRVLVDDDATSVDARPLALEHFRRHLAASARSYDVGLAPRSDHNLFAGFDGVAGVFVATWDQLEPGTMVALTLHLPGGGSIETLGTVEFVRTERCVDGVPGIGLSFRGLDQRDAATLARFAELREPIFHC